MVRVFEPAAEIPRAFEYEGVEAIIENKVARDILKLGLAELVCAQDPVNERFRLNHEHCTLIKKLYGEDQLVELGLI